MDLDLQSLNTSQEVSGADDEKVFQNHFVEDFGDDEDSESTEESESTEDSENIVNSKSIEDSESIVNSKSTEEDERNIIKKGENEIQGYREPSTDSSDDESTSSFDIDSSSDSDPGAFLDTIHKSPVPSKLVNLKTKGEMDLDDMPPVEDLYISVQQDDLVKIGVVWSIHDLLVSVVSSDNKPTLNEDSVLFIAPDKPLGKVFDIFGPVRKPFYVVRFNSVEDIIEKGVTGNTDIFYAPGRSDLVCYVPVDELRKQKGSDASWKDNNEPPEEFLDYSDDEQERAAKQKRRAKNRRETLPDDGITFVPPKIADRRQDTLKCSVPPAANGSTNCENSYNEFQPVRQTFKFRPPQSFVNLQQPYLFRPRPPVSPFLPPPQPPVSPFLPQPPISPFLPQPSVSPFLPPPQPPVSPFLPPPQPPVSTFLPHPPPQRPVSTFLPHPPPQRPISTFLSQPPPQCPVSTFLPQPQPPVWTVLPQPPLQTAVWSILPQRPPQPPVSTFLSQPPPNFNPDQGSRVPIPARQPFVGRAMPVTHQQPVFGHHFRGAQRPVMSPPMPSSGGLYLKFLCGEDYYRPCL